MAASDHLNQQQFYHFSNQKLKTGAHVVSPAELSPDNPRKAIANPAYGAEKRDPTETFFTNDPDTAAGTWGKYAYRVQPLEGQTRPDPNGEEGYDFAHKGHLKVLGRDKKYDVDDPGFG